MMKQDLPASSAADSDPARPGPTGIDQGGKDVAMEMVGAESHEIDPAVTARAVRKIDLFLIPAMTIGCTFYARAATYIV